MLKVILNDATKEDLMNIVCDLMRELNITMPRVYETLLIDLHKNVYGFHFSEELALKAVRDLKIQTETKVVNIH